MSSLFKKKNHFQIDKNVLQCWGLGECQDDRLLKVWCNKTVVKVAAGNLTDADHGNDVSKA